MIIEFEFFSVKKTGAADSRTRALYTPSVELVSSQASDHLRLAGLNGNTKLKGISGHELIWQVSLAADLKLAVEDAKTSLRTWKTLGLSSSTGMQRNFIEPPCRRARSGWRARDDGVDKPGTCPDGARARAPLAKNVTRSCSLGRVSRFSPKAVAPVLRTRELVPHSGCCQK
jgi:hypothetical protein